MQLYCKNCRQTHAVWNRLDHYLICGHCGSRVRETEHLLVTPIPAEARPVKPVKVEK